VVNTVTDIGVEMLGLRVRHWFAACAGLVVLCALTSACSAPKPAPAPPPALPPVLWGEMKPIVSVKELMRFMIDPLADNVFDAVSTVVTNKAVEHMPVTEEDWEKIRIGGVSMAEGAYLLKVRRPFAPAGDVNNSAGPDAVELSPDQITAKVEKDPVEWNARIEALRNVGLEVIEIAKKKDASQLWGASQDLDEACEACHKSYWYPGEDDKFYKKLNDRLRSLTDGRPAPAAKKKP
jgi:hypothetical protein